MQSGACARLGIDVVSVRDQEKSDRVWGRKTQPRGYLSVSIIRMSNNMQPTGAQIRYLVHFG